MLTCHIWKLFSTCAASTFLCSLSLLPRRPDGEARVMMWKRRLRFQHNSSGLMNAFWTHSCFHIMASLSPIGGNKEGSIPDFTTTDIFVTACASAAPLFLPGPLSSLSNCCLGPAALQSAWKNTLTAGKKFIHPVQTKPRKRKEIVSSNCFVTFPPSHSSHSHDLSQSCCLFWSKKSSYLFANFTRDWVYCDSNCW